MPAIESAPSRSSFVTVLAWVFIVLAGFATLMSLFQNVMLALVFPADEMRTAMHEAKRDQQLSGFARFMFEHFRLIFALFFALSALTLASAIGLLKRKNWARIVFIGIMVIGVLWSAAGMVMPFFIFSAAPNLPRDVPAEFRDGFPTMMNIAIAFNVALALIFAVLFGWIIKRLLSREVRREFAAL